MQSMGRPCDICGHLGYADCLVTCSICQTSHEHIYCMRKNLIKIPEKWTCEACSQSKHIENTRISDKKRMGSPILGSSLKRAVPRNMKVVETGKVKFLPAEDVLMLASGAKTKAGIIRGRLGSQTCSSRASNYPISKKTTISVAEASKQFSQKVSSHRSPRPSKASVFAIGQPSSSLQQVAKTSPQQYNNKSPLYSPSYRSPSNYSGGPMEPEARGKLKEPQLLRNTDAKVYHSPPNCSGPLERESKEKLKEPQLLRNADATVYLSPSNCSGPLKSEAKEKPKEPQLVKNADSEAYPSPSNFYGHMDRLSQEKPKEPQLWRMDKLAGKEVCKPNKELVCKEQPVHVSLPAKEEGSPEHTSSPPGESKICSRVEGLPAYLGINATWKGSFAILDTVPTGELYEGLQAHPPGKIRRKAYEVSKQMPRTLQFKLHPRSDVWPEIFNINCPTGNDIALYFLPGDFERSNEKYISLMNLITVRDLAMQSCFNGVELLIFTSKQLPADSQRINMKTYLWGVFRYGKTQLCSPSKLLMRSQDEHHDSVCSYADVIDPLNVVVDENDDAVDMEIDMIGGKDVGRIDKPVEKPNPEEKKVQFKLVTAKKKYINSNVLDFQKNLDLSSPQHLSIVKVEQPIEVDAPPGFSNLVTNDAAHKCLLGAPPGFSTPLMPKEKGDSSAAHKRLLGPPGFSKPLMPKERGDSSETNHTKESACPAHKYLLGPPPGFSKPLMPKEKGDSSETNHTKESACAAHKCLLGPPPGFSKPLMPKEREDASETNHKKESAGNLDVNTLSSSKKRSSFTDSSIRDFKGSSLQPQKPTQVSPEFSGKSHQVAMSSPMYSVTTDLKPLSEKRKKGSDAIQKDVIQYDIKDCLPNSLPKSFHVWDDLKTKPKVRECGNIGATGHEMREPSNKPRHKTVAECLQLFPKVEMTKEQQLETNAKLKLGSPANKLAEDKDSPVLRHLRPLCMKDGQRSPASQTKSFGKTVVMM